MEEPKITNKAAAMKACINHARALVDSAKTVYAAGHQNIAYHLATLALEELGRRELIAIQEISEKQPVPPAWVQKHAQDHIKKLFWCFFGAEFFAEKISKDGLKSMENFANQIHAKRISGLYVDHDEDGLKIPAESISIEEADNIIKLAEARVGLAENTKLRDDIPQEERDLQAWFLVATDDPEKRKMILSKTSLDKLTELKNVSSWGRWLKDQFDQAEAESRAAVEEELKRSCELPAKGSKNKWKLRIRVFCQSHSIRPKALSKWNETVNWIKLVPVSGKKDQLIVEFLLQDNVPVEGLWWFGWGLARHFVTALNIGTMGFWWWQMPRQISKFYEDIEDLDKKKMVAVERSPSLKIDWGPNRVLTEQDMVLVSTCFATLPGPKNRDQHKAYDYYIGGTTFLSLNDVHWQCEDTAFRNFFESIRAMMEQHGDWRPGMPFIPELTRFLDDLFPELDERSRFIDIFEAFENKTVDTVKITLKEVSFMKLFCDAYYLNKIRPKGLKEIQSKKADMKETT